MGTNFDDETMRRGIEALGMDSLLKNHPTLAAEIAAAAQEVSEREREQARVDTRKRVFDIIDDLVGSFVYYDRKESTFGVDDLNRAVTSGVVTPDEIIDRFADGIRTCKWGADL
jgi:hypothetical protein